MGNNRFAQANDWYRQGAYNKAFVAYKQAYLADPEFKHYAANLVLSACKIGDPNICKNGLLDIYQAQHTIAIDKAKSIILQSKRFDFDLYKSLYGCFIPDGIDPILHYLSVGWALNLNKAIDFDIANYQKKQRKKERETSFSLLHYLVKKTNTNSGQSIAEKLNTQLWGGHSETALKELRKIAENEVEDKNTRWWAIWYIARWDYFLGHFEQTLILIKKLKKLDLGNKTRRESVYLEYFSLLHVNCKVEARTVLADYLRLFPHDADALLAHSNSLANDAERLQAINTAFDLCGFVGVSYKNPQQPLSLTNLQGQQTESVIGDKKISIIMPIYNAEGQVGIAIQSLLEQSYKNIEIIAVDDCSTDETFSILAALEKKDSRVKALKAPQNAGAYAARNYGLERASGDLITTHDSDDWSHPQKIATQVDFLQKNPAVMGCVVHWARVEKNLCFTQNWRPNGHISHWSHSSFMFRKSVMDTLGKWDQVRIGGDTEYIWRMQAHFGKASFAKIYDGIPLAFALDEESSLTRTKATHVRTVYFGLRHIYREIASWWQRYHSMLCVQDAGKGRPFKAPLPMLEKVMDPVHFDVVIAGDFSRLSDALTVAKWQEQNPNKSVALFHWPLFGHAGHSLCNLYFELLLRKNVEPIVAGQKVQATTYHLTDLRLAESSLDGYPLWENRKQWSEM